MEGIEPPLPPASQPWAAMNLRLAARAASIAASATDDGPGGSDADAPRRLDASTVSEMRHNGTHMERIVHARWQCTFPEGKCFAHHAPLEGMPEKMDKCTQEANKGALAVEMAIDLDCAGMGGQIDCDRITPQEFDPFQLCNNDPLLVKATCHLECRKHVPFELCRFEFDTGRTYNMSDDTVDSCNMEAICKSPYIEQNEMFCSGHHTTQKHQPHWITEERPWVHREKHGLEAPPPPSAGLVVQAQPQQQPSPVPRTLPQSAASAGGSGQEVLWALALLLLAFAGLLMAGRFGWLPKPIKRYLEALGIQFGGDARSFPSTGATYRAPAGDRAMRYVAPSPQGAPGKTVVGCDADEGLDFSSGR